MAHAAHPWAADRRDARRGLRRRALAAHVYTDLLWFAEVGQPRLYWTTLAWKVLPVAVFALGATCVLLANVALFERRLGRRPIHALGAIAGGLVSLKLQPGDLWRLLALWAHRSDFGTRDPLFDRDVGFYVFSLPLQQALARGCSRSS